MMRRPRSKRLVFALTLSLGVSGATPAQAASRSREYVNPRFGFKLVCPSTLIAGPERADGSGCEFHSANGEFKVFAFAQPTQEAEETAIERLYASEKQTFGGKITYEVKEKHWFAVSGVAANGVEFYSKVYAHGATITFLRMTYPHAGHRHYDQWVTMIEKRFVPAQK